MMNQQQQAPWFRVPLMWLVVALPATAVVAGFATLYLAIASDDGLVVDDYYRRGKQINQDLKRDQVAARQGLSGTLELDPGAAMARFALRAASGSLPPDQIPDQLTVQFVYSTRTGHDREVRLARSAGGLYFGGLPALREGRWNVQISAGDWRLNGSLHLPRETRAEFTAPSGV